MYSSSKGLYYSTSLLILIQLSETTVACDIGSVTPDDNKEFDSSSDGPWSKS